MALMDTVSVDDVDKSNAFKNILCGLWMRADTSENIITIVPRHIFTSILRALPLQSLYKTGTKFIAKISIIFSQKSTRQVFVELQREK